MFGKNAKEYKEWLAHRDYLDTLPEGIKVVNTGSTAGYNAFDYSDWPIPGYNFGWQPQTLYYDFETLKRFESHLAAGAVIFITIEHFKFLVDHYPDPAASYRYYFFLEPEQIKDYDPETARRLRLCPCFVYKKLLRGAVISFVKRILRYKKPEFSSHEEKDAYWGKRCLEGWYKEFGWQESTRNLSAEQRECVAVVLNRLKAMLDYCVSHGWKPVVVVLPLSPSISDSLPPTIMEECLWRPLAEIRDAGYPVVDLFHESNFHNAGLYENALTMNHKGRQAFNTIMKTFIQ